LLISPIVSRWRVSIAMGIIRARPRCKAILGEGEFLPEREAVKVGDIFFERHWSF
jgi:hypothetical protein